jgi:WD40 repeat protein
MSLASRGTFAVFARTALFLFLPLPVLAEPGPSPHEYRTDRNGYPLPPGAVARLGVPPALGGFPWALGWTADGRRFVTVDYGGVTVFDAGTGRWIESQAIGTEGRSLYTPLSHDGRFLFLLNGRTGVLYDTATAATHTFTLPAPFGDRDGKVHSLSLSADCRFLAGLAGSVAWRYDLARDRFTRIITGRADVHSVRLSPDGKRAFATGGIAEPELSAHDLVTGKELWAVRLKNIGQLRAMSADGRRLAVSDGDGVRVFDTSDGKLVLTAPVDSSTPPGLWGIDLSPDGGRLALAVDREVAIWDAATGTVRHRLPHAARLVSFSPDGRSLLTVSAWVQRWDVETGRPAFPAPIIDKPLAASLLRWSRDGKRLLTVWPGDRRGGEPEWKPDVLAVWDVGTMQPVWRLTSKEPILDAALDRGGSTVRLVRESGYRIWPTDGSAPTNVLLKPRAAFERAVDFLPGDRLLTLAVVDEAVASDLYDPAGRLLVSYRVSFFADEQHEQYPRWPVALTRGLPGVQLRPPGRRMDLTTGRPLPPLDTRGDLFILKGQPVAGGSAVVGSRIQINGPWGGPAVEGIVWDALTGGQIVRLLDRIPDWGLAALSADGRWLAYASGEVVEVTDLATFQSNSDPAQRARLRLPAADTKALAFAPEGPRLATAHADGTVLIWELPTRREPWHAADADRLWADLGSSVTADAWRAQWHLLAYPDLATGLLMAKAKPVPAQKDTAELIAKLDHARYAVREEAARDLARRGTVVEGDLRTALQKPTSAEQRERLEGLLAKLNQAVPPVGDELRSLRAVWLLEQIGTAEARKVLEKLAGGASGSRVTAEAKAALNRLR